jgi:hypothetical protein
MASIVAAHVTFAEEQSAIVCGVLRIVRGADGAYDDALGAGIARGSQNRRQH